MLFGTGHRFLARVPSARRQTALRCIYMIASWQLKHLGMRTPHQLAHSQGVSQYLQHVVRLIEDEDADGCQREDALGHPVLQAAVRADDDLVHNPLAPRPATSVLIRIAATVIGALTELHPK